MTSPDHLAVSGAVEGLLDEAVLGRLVQHVGATPGPVHGKMGKQWLLQRLNSFNAAAHWSPWLVLVDLDQDADCAPPFRASYLPNPVPQMCFRIAVRAVEAWLMADRERLARFLGVPISRVPAAPEAIPDPKQTMVDLAGHSRRRSVREEMVPRPGSGRTVGPAYAARLIEFVTEAERGWRPDVAAQSSPSLERCLRCLRRVVQRG